MGYNRELEAIMTIVVTLLFVLSVIIGLMGPEVLLNRTVAAKSLPSFDPDNFEGPYEFLSQPLTSFSQELWLSARMERSPSDYKISKHITYSVTVKEHIYDVGDHLIKNKTRGTYTRNATLDCDQDTCKEIMLLHLVTLKNIVHEFRLTFTDLDQTTGMELSGIDFIIRNTNAQFTYFELLGRILALIAAFLVTIVFLRSMRPFRFGDWTLEQKWLACLLPMLLLFNNPFNPVHVLVEGSTPLTIDAIFQLSFIAALLLFWLSALHGIRRDDRGFLHFYLPKMILVASIWLCTIVLALFKIRNERSNPLFDSLRDSRPVLSVEILLAILGFIYALAFIVLMLRACSELRHLPYFNVRLNVLSVFAVVIAILCSLFIFVRYASGFQFQTHDIMGSTRPSTNYRSAAEVSVFYVMLNTYVGCMAIVYSPSRNALIDANFGDNPAISMMNDSDEEVMYESDNEDRIPLTRRH